MTLHKRLLVCISLVSIFTAALSAGSVSSTFAEENRTNLSLSMISILAQNKVMDEGLSSGEKTGLVQMREEEKLARDVYTVLYEKWASRVFDNISRSEQRHMDEIKTVLDLYTLDDPITDQTVGSFATPEFQELYNSLLESGSTSLVDALQVGATVEDLDLKDLYDLLEQTNNSDIQAAYLNLAKGSRNHLRSFTSQLSKNGSSYVAQFLTQEQVDEIISSPKE